MNSPLGESAPKPKPSVRPLRIESIPPLPGSRGDGLHWFRIEFPDREGRCLITRGDAQHLRQLTLEWVGRALGNLAARYGWDWLEETACSTSGLILNHCDAADLSHVSRPRRKRLPPAGGSRSS